jgi:hypothetical protein
MTIAPIVIGAAPAYLILLLFARDNLCSSSPLGCCWEALLACSLATWIAMELMSRWVRDHMAIET